MPGFHQHGPIMTRRAQRDNVTIGTNAPQSAAGSFKAVPKSVRIGQRGINVIERIVEEMGPLWTPARPASDAGTDGFIELCDHEGFSKFNYLLLIISPMLLVASTAFATTYTVTTTNDTGPGSLRAVIATANGVAGPHTISLATFPASSVELRRNKQT